MTYDQWFRSQQGIPYAGQYLFAESAWEHQQSIIDALMLEFCPERMSKEQVELWSDSQEVVK